MSPAHTLALHLESLGLGTIGQDLHISREPASPDFVTTLYDTGGDEADTDELDIMRPTIQVRVRSFDYAQAHARHLSIRDALHFTDSGFMGVFMTTDVISIGRDDNDRHLLTSNYAISQQLAVNGGM